MSNTSRRTQILELFITQLQNLGFQVDLQTYISQSKPFLQICNDVQKQPVHELSFSNNKFFYQHPIHGERAFQLRNMVAKGSYGYIYSSIWVNNIEELYIKQSKQPLLKEVLLQIMACCVLEVYNFSWVVPKINDVFSSQQNGHMFTMIPKKDSTIYQIYLKNNYKSSPCVENDIMLFEVVCQMALYNYILEEEIGLNHRDLQTRNILMICPNESQDTIHHDAKDFEISIHAKNHALMVDFGNSCIPQNETRVYTPSHQYSIDSTPKAGRDLFQMLAYLYNQTFIRNGLTETGHALFHTFLQGAKRNWADFLKESTYSEEENFNVIYMMSFGFKFCSVNCTPLSLFQTISKTYPQILTLKEKI